jgi:hypothetical protein
VRESQKTKKKNSNPKPKPKPIFFPKSRPYLILIFLHQNSQQPPPIHLATVHPFFAQTQNQSNHNFQHPTSHRH